MTPDQLDSELTNEAIEFVRGGFRRRAVSKPTVGRLSEVDAMESGTSREVSPYRVPVQDEHMELKDALKASLVRYSHIERLSAMIDPEPEDIVLAYQDITSALKRMQDEWLGFLKSLVRIDVTRIGYLGRESDALVTKAVDRCAKDIFSKPEMSQSRIYSPFTAQAISGSTTEVTQIAIRSAEHLVTDFVNKMIMNLDCLLNNCVCGIISRHPNQVCEYFYGYRKLVIETDSPLASRSTLWMHETERRKVSAGILSVTTNAVSQFTVCFERHHLIHVIETEPEAGLVHVPRFQKQVIESIPAWLRPSVRLIEGTMIGRQLIEHDHAPEKISHQAEEAYLEDLEIDFRFDPAVILGQFVLTGWGPSEIAEDLAINEVKQIISRQETAVSKIANRFDRLFRKIIDL